MDVSAIHADRVCGFNFQSPGPLRLGPYCAEATETVAGERWFERDVSLFQCGPHRLLVVVDPELALRMPTIISKTSHLFTLLAIARTMHLDHKLPWGILASHYTLVKDNKGWTPIRTDIFSVRSEHEEKEFGHFLRKFCAVLKEFSDTELKKYDVGGALDLDKDELFSDPVLSSLETIYNLEPYRSNSLCSNPLSKNHQSLAYWIKQARDPDDESICSYTTMDASLAEALKGLIIIASTPKATPAVRDSATTAMLRLSRHPMVPLNTLNNLGWGHAFGVNFVPLVALEFYLLLNVVDRLCENGNKVPLGGLRVFQNYVSDVVSDDDFPFHKKLHEAFWKKCGYDYPWLRQQRYGAQGAEARSDEISQPLFLDPLVQCREECQQYLRECFGLMYRYDMLFRMWYGDKRADEQWEYDIKLILREWGSKLF